jgi:hypothetical protein
MRRRALLALLLAGALAAGGCSTLADEMADRGTGRKASYAAPYEQVWAALAEILKELGMRVRRENRAAGYISAEDGASAFGMDVVIYVEPIGTRGFSRVEVVAKGSLGLNLTDFGDAAKSIHDKLATRFRRL